MSNDSARTTSFCGKCLRPVAQPVHTARDLPQEPRHIGVPGEPVACPE